MLNFQENCKEIADKYVEYDIVIIIIDLVLLNTMAYRHILLNTDFKVCIPKTQSNSMVLIKICF